MAGAVVYLTFRVPFCFYFSLTISCSKAATDSKRQNVMGILKTFSQPQTNPEHNPLLFRLIDCLQAIQHL